MEKRLLQVRELAKTLGTTPRRIEGWVEQGLLKPAVRGRGPGRRRAFTVDNLLAAAILLKAQRAFGEKSGLIRPLADLLHRPQMRRRLRGLAQLPPGAAPVLVVDTPIRAEGPEGQALRARLLSYLETEKASLNVATSKPHSSRSYLVLDLPFQEWLSRLRELVER